MFWLVPAVLMSATDPAVADKRGANESAEAAVRANVNAFVRAYNAGDAKGIANLFAPEAQMIDEDENTTQGRPAIERAFAAIFARSPQTRIDVEVASIRVIGSALAIETGSTKVASKPGEVPEVSRYTVVHVKSEVGTWFMAFARDNRISSDANFARTTDSVHGTALARENGEVSRNNSERLKPLEWMIGDWIDEGSESIVLSSCKWSADKNYILQNIEVRMQGRDALDLNQRIGWESHHKTDQVVGVRLRRWLRRILLDAERRPLGRQGDRRPPRRHDVVGNQRHYADQQGLVHLAVHRPRRRN